MRSSSDQTPSPGGQPEARSPTHNPGFQALSKIRKSLREKRPGMGPRRQLTVEDVSRELVSVRDDLQVCQYPPRFPAFVDNQPLHHFSGKPENILSIELPMSELERELLRESLR